MKYELNIPRQSLINILHTNYSFKILSIEFLPLGEDGWVYKVQDTTNKFWFVKVTKAISSNLILLNYLSNSLKFNFIPATQQTTQGKSVVVINDLYLTVQEFIQGPELQDDITNSNLVKLGENLNSLFNAIHVVPKTITTHLSIESFERHQKPANSVINKALKSPAKNLLVKELVKFINSNVETINHLLQSTKSLGDYHKKQKYEFGICHSDIHYSNILVNGTNKLYFIDWDGVMLAPRERDLFFYTDNIQVNPYVLKGYKDYECNSKLLIYYKYEWAVQEIADYGMQIYSKKLSTQQREYALQSFIELFDKNNVVQDALKYHFAPRR